MSGVRCRRRLRLSSRLDADFIRISVLEGDYLISLHADMERLEDGIAVAELEEVLADCEVIEDYPDDPRGHSCLVLGYMSNREPLHVVCGLNRQNAMFVITVYKPCQPKWVDERIRRSES